MVRPPLRLIWAIAVVPLGPVMGVVVRTRCMISYLLLMSIVMTISMMMSVSMGERDVAASRRFPFWTRFTACLPSTLLRRPLAQCLPVIA